MKIGSVAWGWTPVPEDIPSGNMLVGIADNVQKLGFDYVDFLSTWESLDQYYTEAECRRVAAHCREIGLGIQGFVYQSAAWNVPDAAVRRKQTDYFRLCADRAVALGASMISCIIPGPYGAKPNKKSAPSDKIASNLPADYDFAADWDRFVEGIAGACDIAAEHGLSVAMECFPRSLCSTPNAMLNLLKDADKPNLGIQLDTAHLCNQRIDIETAIFMLGGSRIINVHFKDSDGVTRENLAAGMGVIDYVAVIRALRNVGYAGNASIEVEFTDHPKRYMKQALDHIKLCLAEA